MTPEQIQHIRGHLGIGNGSLPNQYARDLLDYIDLLHEDLRITRAERDAEKRKRMTEAKERALPEGARTMPDGSIRLGNRNYLKGKDTK